LGKAEEARCTAVTKLEGVGREGGRDFGGSMQLTAKVRNVEQQSVRIV